MRKHLPALALFCLAPAVLSAQNTPAPAPTLASRTPAAAPAPTAPPPASVHAPAPATSAPTAPQSTQGVPQPWEERAAPATPVPVAKQPPNELLLLLGIPHDAPADTIRAYAQETRARARLVADPVLRSQIRLHLARLHDHPEQSRQIHAEYKRKLADYFFAKSRDALSGEKPDYKAAENAALLAILSAPAHLSARFLLAQLAHVRRKNSEGAIKILGDGFHFADVGKSDIARAYLAYYLDLLEKAQRDDEVLRITLSILKAAEPPKPEVMEILNSSAAAACLWLGRYDEAVTHIRQSGLKNSSSRLLEARALFGKGDTKAAIALLYKSAPNYAGLDRDAIMGQIVRFFAELGQLDSALQIAAQRVNEFPDNPATRVHRLHLLDLARKHDELNRELQIIFERFSNNPAAVLAVAAFASGRGHPVIAERCLRIVEKNAKDAVGAADVDFFAGLLVEAFLRAKRPTDAIAAVKR
ncbi:MAG: hypothetical protein LBT53_00705, partial [Puniceicoccales bacterium]|nr:hypothetical protein [Puniceicoccales bacterium]